MAGRISRIIGTLRKRINERRLKPFLIFAVTGALAIAAWLGWPWLVQEPYVRVQSSSFILTTPCIPLSAAVHTRTQYAVLTRARVVLQDAKRVWAQHSVVGSGSRSDGQVQFFVTVPRKVRSDVKEYERKAQLEEDPIGGIALDFVQVPSLDLLGAVIEYPNDEVDAQCRNEKLSGEDLEKRIRGSRARVMHYYLLHDALSDIIFRANEIAGNILLACLMLAFLWLVVQLVPSMIGVYLVSDDRLIRRLRGEGRTTAIQNVYSATHKRLAFSRVLGPALGFLLTVSSLVAGLHPSATATKDAFQFVSSLQLALVATFMGLAVRILAEFVIRFERELAQRKLDLLERKQEK